MDQSVVDGRFWYVQQLTLHFARAPGTKLTIPTSWRSIPGLPATKRARLSHAARRAVSARIPDVEPPTATWRRCRLGPASPSRPTAARLATGRGARVDDRRAGGERRQASGSRGRHDQESGARRRGRGHWARTCGRRCRAREEVKEGQGQERQDGVRGRAQPGGADGHDAEICVRADGGVARRYRPGELFYVSVRLCRPMAHCWDERRIISSTTRLTELSRLFDTIERGVFFWFTQPEPRHIPRFSTRLTNDLPVNQSDDTKQSHSVTLEHEQNSH